MTYPELFWIPVLMLLDYALTIWGQGEYVKAYGRHFRLPQYELNPMWQKDVAARRWWNPRHVFLAVFYPGALWVLIEISGMPYFIGRFFIGALIGVFSYLMGRHISNLVLFKYLSHYPQDVSGEVSLSYRYMMVTSAVMAGTAAVPLGCAALISRSSFVLGCWTGLVLLILVHLAWFKEWQKKNPS